VTDGILEYHRMEEAVDGSTASQSVAGDNLQIVESSQDWVAEPVLWTNEWHYLGNLTSVRSAELLRIDPDIFATIVGLNPMAYAIVSLYAVGYTQWLQTLSMDNETLSDISFGDDLAEDLSALITDPTQGTHSYSTKPSHRRHVKRDFVRPAPHRRTDELGSADGSANSCVSSHLKMSGTSADVGVQSFTFW